MKRLTGRKDGHAYIIGCPDFALPKIAGLIIQQTVDRLASIEDILGNEYDLDELKEVVQAKREGRCVVLPAKVDETVYQVKKGDDCPCCFRLEGVNISEDGDITYPIYWGESFTPDDFGNKLFKTHNEAMAALRREQE